MWSAWKVNIYEHYDEKERQATRAPKQVEFVEVQEIFWSGVLLSGGVCQVMWNCDYHDSDRKSSALMGAGFSSTTSTGLQHPIVSWRERWVEVW